MYTCLIIKYKEVTIELKKKNKIQTQLIFVHIYVYVTFNEHFVFSGFFFI